MPVTKEGDTIVMQDDEKFLTKLDSLEERLRTEFDERMKDLEQQLLELKESTK